MLRHTCTCTRSFVLTFNVCYVFRCLMENYPTITVYIFIYPPKKCAVLFSPPKGKTLMEGGGGRERGGLRRYNGPSHVKSNNKQVLYNLCIVYSRSPCAFNPFTCKLTEQGTNATFATCLQNGIIHAHCLFGLCQ